MLRALPRVFPYQPVLRVPERLVRVASAVLYTLLASANQTATLPEEQADAAYLSHELLRAAPMLLFRPTLREQDATPDSGTPQGAFNEEGGHTTR